MTSLRVMMALFALALAACVGFLMLHAYRGLDAEDHEQHQDRCEDDELHCCLTPVSMASCSRSAEPITHALNRG